MTYSLKAGADAGLFSIDANSGEVTLSGNPDYEAQASYSFTVIATDDSNNSTEQTVTLNINDLDEGAPQFTSGATATAIDENSGAGRLVYTATATDTGSVTYSLKAGDDAGLFSIDATSGEVTLSGNPDYEAQASYSFTVIATDDSNNSTEQTVTLNINDLDEGAPQFTSGAIADAIDENSGAGRLVYTATATDTGTVTYSLKAGDDAGLFSIDANSGQVTLSGDPDFETKPSYSFTVIATDNAGNSSEQSVTLAVNNLDENAPQFTSGATATAIDENSGAGQLVYTATATDSGAVTYSLKAGDDAALFSIDATSGEVTLSVEPDYETQASYSFTVIATDDSNNSTEQTVTLNINDLDEGAPQFTSGAIADAIDENSGAGRLVYTATATDTGSVTYSLKAGDDAVLFSIDANSGQVTLSGDPDFETKPSYSFTVIATDDAGNSTEQSVTLAVNNLDENAPQFTSGATATAIDENSGAEQVIYTATATDSGTVTYSLKTGADAGLFSIDANSGEVTLTGDPDFETKPSYSFTVIATDESNNSSEQSVTLAVNNLDENAPQFTSGAIATAIDENSGAGQVIYTATATDTGSVTYSLKAGDDAGLFSIDATSGEVTLSGNPDYEAQASYSFTVIATDDSNNSTEQTVTLNINDLDEGAPQFTSGATATAIDENSGAEQVIYTATATDSGTVTYSLKTGADAGLFSIDANSGEVTLTGDPDFETKPSYSFTVIATDESNNSSEQSVTFAVNNLDENAPQFTSGAIATAIDENSGAEQVIYTATATDSGTVTYSLKTGADAGLFSIDANSGEVTLTGDPDFETKPSYSFTVIATDNVGNSSEQSITLAVNNLDENAPQFTSGATATAIDENSGAEQVIYTATATDSGTVTYSLKTGADAGLFSIDANSGEVTLTGDPDFETKPSYSFTVIATDESNNSSEQSVTLAVNNLDENAPQFTSGATATAIDENSGAGQVIYTATATDTGTVTYSLKAGDDAGLFSIDANSGQVTLSGDPDFETKPSYSFTVIATDNVGNSSEQSVTLAVNNLDENAPQFTSGATATAIDENSGAGQVIYTATATDTGTVTYSLKAGDDAGLFSIDANSGQVTLSGDPDFETKPSYSFTVIATDNVGNSSEQSVTLAVNNLDENAPQFTSGATATAIDENSGAGQVIYTATATDTGTVTYSLKAGDDAGLFSIDANSGQVTLSGDPDFETKPSYSFTVIATDNVGNSSEQSVTLAVNNLDENAPQFTSGATATAIDENSGAGQVIYTATATDSGAVTYSLKAGDDAALFSIDATSGEVTLSVEPDYETQASYSFTVIATDDSNNSTEQTVTLNINDLDEGAPQFTSGATATVIDENSGAGQVIYTATATDTGTVTYSLKAGDDAGLFSIDANSGEVTLTGDPDYEAKASYSFTVIATDNAGNSSEQSITLAVNNLDENAPQFTSGATATAIDENSGAEQVIYTATATDNGTVTYSLKAGDDAGLFSIDSNSGQVTLTGDPDFETKPSYSFTVIATDNAGNSSEQSVTLAVNNLDENAPQFTSGATATAIDENSGAEQVIYTATATDNGTVTYSLKAGDDAGLFSIDSNSGQVTLTGDPDFETKPSYSFTVIATDNAGNSSEQSVTLAVNNLDENAPQFTSGVTATAIDENSGTEQVIYTATATDSGTVTYSLKAGDDAGLFSIDANSGEVTLSGDPDYEAKASYAFTVIATDESNNSAERTVTLNINDLDENAPTFTSGATAAAINENSGAGQTIYTAVATDDAGTVIYSLKNSGDVAAFTINAATGAVTLNGDPDYEAKASYAFTVIATDESNNSAERTVTLNINDLDENAPTFTSGATAAAINENSGAGQTIYTAVATDDAGTVIYSLKNSGDVAAFTINAATGAVTLSGDPDYEAKASYAFTVIATDESNNSAERTVTLNINDLDENAPTFTSGATAAAINENSGAGQTIYTAAATDDAGTVTYSLKNSGDVAAFTINAATGAVTLNGDPDYEAKASYAFTVIATDESNNSAERTVTLSVNDLDEVAPSAPTLTLNNDSGENTNDLITNDGIFTISGVEDGATVEYSTDNTNWSTTKPTAQEGSNTIYARQSDSAGNVSPVASLNFTLDTTSPFVVITSGSYTNSSNPVFSGIADAGSDITLEVGGALYSTITDSEGDWSIDTGSVTPDSGTLSLPADGEYIVEVTSSDVAGNSYTANQTLHLDTQAPTLLDISVPNETLSLNNVLTATFTFSESVKDFIYDGYDTPWGVNPIEHNGISIYDWRPVAGSNNSIYTAKLKAQEIGFIDEVELSDVIFYSFKDRAGNEYIGDAYINSYVDRHTGTPELVGVNAGEYELTILDNQHQDLELDVLADETGDITSVLVSVDNGETWVELIDNKISSYSLNGTRDAGIYLWSNPTLPLGENDLLVKVSNSIGNYQQSSIPYTVVENIPPVITTEVITTDYLIEGMGSPGAEIVVDSYGVVTVDDTGYWSLRLDPNEFSGSEGDWSFYLEQTDVYGLWIEEYQDVMVDTLAYDPSEVSAYVGDVGYYGHITSVEKTNGFSLSGWGEPNVDITVSIKSKNGIPIVLENGNVTTVDANGDWALSVTSQDIAKLKADEEVYVTASQSDAYGNISYSETTTLYNDPIIPDGLHVFNTSYYANFYDIHDAYYIRGSANPLTDIPHTFPRFGNLIKF
ncbi:cadherin repeat domain-containing protein [Ectothiorhodospiraceae bacterium BW-2]|nr:cadherin repeat domain-containing protein [Ectothiorhodospiraceae bacterium BW-2]